MPINGGVIDLGGADYVLIKSYCRQIEQSVHIHMLTQDVVDAGVAEKKVYRDCAKPCRGGRCWRTSQRLKWVFLRPPASEFTELRRALMWWIPLRWNGATWNAWPRTRVGRISALRAFGSVTACPITAITMRLATPRHAPSSFLPCATTLRG